MSNNNRDDTNHAWAECPTKKIHNLWKKTKAQDKKNFDEAGLLRTDVRSFVDGVLAERCCLNIYRLPNKTKCVCTEALDEALSDSQRNELVVYIIYFHTACEKKERQASFIQWVKYGKLQQSSLAHQKEKHRVYILPGVSGTHVICRNTLCRFLGFGRWQIQTVLKFVDNNESPSHGLDNKPSNSTNAATTDLLSTFFEEILQFANPRATKIVRSVVGEEVVSELADEETQELPVYFSKRSMFKRLLSNAGWDIKLDSKCRVVSVTPINDAVQVVTTKEELPTWQAFLRYWKQHYPKLICAKPREDVCGECFVFANSHQFTSQQKKKNAEDSTDDEEEAADEGAEVDDNNMEEREDVIERAALHVTMAKQQRLFFNLKKQQSKDDCSKTLLDNSNKVWTFVADYAQNMYVPNFAAEQPGETHYCSPMNAYIFGVACTGYTPTKLVAHVYLEDQGGKGSNNVASLLHRELRGRGVIGKEARVPAAKELNFVFDNCGGQNKNKTVLRMMPYLVARGAALVARAIFLVRGHTKNDCDGLFNLMKHQYRKKNTFTPQQLTENMKHPDVQVARVDPKSTPTFRDWGKWQDKFLSKTIKDTRKYHMFTCDKSKDPNALYCSTHCGAEEEVKVMAVKKECHGEDWATATFPEALTPPGTQDTKYKELYDKWRPLTPEEYRKQWQHLAQDPGPEFRKRVNEASKQRKENRKKSARGSAIDTAEPAKKKAEHTK